MPADPSAAADDPRALARDVRELSRVLRHGWRHIAVAVLAASTLAAVYLARATRLYQATAQVLVLQQGGRPLSVGDTDPMKALSQDDLITTHALVIASPLVVGRALESIPAAERPSLADAADPVKLALERLKVTRPDRTAKILKLSYRAGSRAEATRTVAAILASYERFLADSYQKNSNDVVALITRARDELGRDIERLQAEYLKLYEGGQRFTADESGRSFVARRLEQWDREANDATVKAIRLRSQLQLVRTLSGQGAGLFAVAQAVEQLGAAPIGLAAAAGSNPGLGSDYLRLLIQQQQELAEKYGPEFAKVRDLQAQIDRVQRATQDTRGRLDRAEMGQLAAALEESLKLIEGLRDEYRTRFTQELGQAREAEDARIKETALRTNLERHQALFNTVVEQLKQAEFTSDFSTVSAQTIEPPNAPPGAVAPRVGMTLALALAGGLALGCVAAVGADRLDQRIHTPEELRQLLDVAVLGEVPRAASGPGTPPFGRITLERPRSTWAEAYRAVRTNLDFLRRQRRLQVLLVTSPHSGDGKSSTASNLAQSLALAGRRVLLVDGDLRKPSQGGIFGLMPGPGLTTLLQGEGALADFVVERGHPNLHLLPAGLEVASPAELLTSGAFARLVEELRSAYDVVLIDSPPILAVADAAVIAAVADGIILVVRPDTLRHFEVGRVSETLAATGTPVLGAVVNAIDRERDRYGHGYGYGNVYGSSSGDGADGDEDAALASRGDRPSAQANGRGASHVLPTLVLLGALGVLGRAAPAAEPIVLKNCEVEYRRDTRIGVSQPGVLQELSVGLGDAVAAGQVLGHLQDDDLRAALEVDRAAAESQAAIQKSEALYAERLERLRQAELLRTRDASTSFEQRMARLEAETARLDVEDARTQRRLAQLRVRQTEAQLRLREVTSPHAGVVVEVLKEPGELINIDEPVVRVADVQRIRVAGRLDVADAWRVRKGLRATLRPDVPGAALPIEASAFVGEVVFVDPQIDPPTQTCRVVAEVDNRDGALRAGVSGGLVIDLDPDPAPAAPAARDSAR